MPRIYDALLGGKNNYQADRAEASKLESFAPEASALARANRAWLGRAVRFLAGEARSRGAVAQFLDLGSGLPGADNTHEIARRSAHQAKVVYVDRDPVVAAHSRALLEDEEVSWFAEADFSDVGAVLADPVVTAHLDFTQPVSVILCLALHHLSDEQDPHGVLAGYVEAIPSGSMIALTHLHDPGEANPETSEIAKKVHAMFAGGATGTGYVRTGAEITRFFDGLELVDPGLVPITDWWPDGPVRESVGNIGELILGGVARKP
ncbi:SAM-dependent methyltransferase [Amycolatopsis minnesotensis]|uniref:SAM-dependent methyltransferase n=1 Tax=Amycolatopsis minnesotensis TaxID=337894 RepID=A0ABN2QC92_9PSEU